VFGSEADKCIRLRKERAEWDELIASAAPPVPSSPTKDKAVEEDGQLSPINPDLLDSPQRAILERLQAPASKEHPLEVDPLAIQQRLRTISDNLEFTVDQFAHGIHALSTTKETADRLAERSLSAAADVLREREKEQRVKGKAIDPMDALRGLARVLNGRRR
jgi:kinetochore protein Mis13/DSN1